MKDSMEKIRRLCEHEGGLLKRETLYHLYGIHMQDFGSSKVTSQGLTGVCLVLMRL